MRRYLVLVEVTDAGEPDKDGAALYTIRSATHAGRWLKQHVLVAGSDVTQLHFSIRFTEELLP